MLNLYRLQLKSVTATLAATLLLLPFSPTLAGNGPADKTGQNVSASEPVLKSKLVQTQDAAHLLEWIVLSDDNGELPYIVIDKRSAAMLLFDAQGTLLGETPVLIGVGEGDDSSPGIGGMSLSEIGPAERTTPAGRFVAKLGSGLGWKSLLWVDYGLSVALHAVTRDKKKEQRPQRLKSPTIEDNRVTFGCINIDTSFYLKKVKPAFGKGGIVYVLPETKPLEEVFPRVRLLPFVKAEQSQTS